MQGMLIVVLLLLTASSCKCELLCGAECVKLSEEQACQDLVEPPVCPRSISNYPRNHIPNQLSPEITGCQSYPQKTFQAPGTSTTSLELSLELVAYDDMHYNLTVSWGLLDCSYPEATLLEVKLFRLSSNWVLQEQRCISELSAAVKEVSFNGLSYGTSNPMIVQLTATHSNGTVLLVMLSREFNKPSRCSDIKPVSPYRCIEEDHAWRRLSVIDIDTAISVSDGGYEVDLSWRPPEVVEQLEIPVTYFVFLYNSSNAPSSMAAFRTDQRWINLTAFDPTMEYYAKVLLHMSCSDHCGDGELLTIRSKPTSAPVITNITVSPSSVKVFWTQIPSTQQTGIISHYEVLYGIVNQTIHSVTIQNTSIVLYNLEPGAMYTVMVRAHNRIGGGPFSLVEYFTAVPLAGSNAAIAAALSVLSVLLITVLFAVVLTSLIVLVKHRHKVKEKPNPFCSEEGACISEHDLQLKPTVDIKTEETGSLGSSQESVVSVSLPGREITDSSSVRTEILPEFRDALIVFADNEYEHSLAETLAANLFVVEGVKDNAPLKIRPCFPGLHCQPYSENRDLLRLSSAAYVSEMIRSSKNLFFLPIISKHFKEEWDEKTKVTNNLVYCLKLYVSGRMNNSQTLKMIVLYETSKDYDRYTPTELTPYPKRQLDEIKEIGTLVLEQPKCVIGLAS